MTQIFFSELRIPFSSVYFEGKTLRNLDFYSIVKCSHNQPMYRSVIIFFLYVKSFSKLYHSTIRTSVCRTPKTLYKLLFWGSFWGLLVLNSELEKSVAHFTNYHPGTQKSIINTACIFSHSFGWKYIITLNNDYLVLWLLIISNVHSLLSFIISKAIITVSKNIYLIDYWMYTQVCTVWPVCLIVSSEKIQLVRV